MYNSLEKHGIIKKIAFSHFTDDQTPLTSNETFIAHYQLIRNLYNTFFETVNGKISKRHNPGNMHVVTLADNLTHCEHFERFKSIVKPEYHDHLVYLDWHTLCDKALVFANAKKEEAPKLKSHYTLFKKVFLSYD